MIVDVELGHDSDIIDQFVVINISCKFWSDHN